MSNFYFYRLDDASKRRYLEKLEYSGIAFPDPLDTDLRLRLYKSRYLKISPNLTFGDIYIYLVETEHTYTREEFKNYKSLNCYKMILNGRVRDILAYKCNNTEMCVLTCDVQSDETIAKLYRPWTVISCDGVIHNGHCTCMTGLEKVCSHVAALLLSIEIAVQKDSTLYENSGDSCSGEKSPKRNKCMPVSEFYENNKKNNVSTTVPFSKNSVPSLSSVEDYKTRLRAIREIVPNAPIFTLLSDSDFSTSDEENIDAGEDSNISSRQ